MNENYLSAIVVDIYFHIHKNMGPGLFESVYEEIICLELELKGIKYERQKVIPIVWKGQKIEKAFRADIVVDNKLILEVKSIEQISNSHYKQVLTYLKLTKMKLGLLVNFNQAYIRNGIRRIVNGL